MSIYQGENKIAGIAEGQAVVDTVQDGVMNPVTSNAVNDALTNYQSKLSVENLSSTVSSEFIDISKVEVFRYGKVVSVNINANTGLLKSLSQNINNVFITGLPKPASSIIDVQIILDDVNVYQRVWVDNYTNLIVFTGASNYSGNVFISGTYICK